MISIDDYRDEKGNIDWYTMHKAQVAVGEKCMQCGTYISSLFRHIKGPRRCGSCDSLINDSNEISHDSIIRCPKCKNQMIIDNCDLYELYKDGEHDVTCDSCDHEFEVTTTVSFSFTSPEILTEDEEKEEDED